MALEKRNCQERANLCLDLTEWTHNLAYFSAEEFMGFKTDIFWTDYEKICATYPEAEKFHRLFKEDQRRCCRRGVGGAGALGDEPS